MNGEPQTKLVNTTDEHGVPTNRLTRKMKAVGITGFVAPPLVASFVLLTGVSESCSTEVVNQMLAADAAMITQNCGGELVTAALMVIGGWLQAAVMVYNGWKTRNATTASS